MADALSHSIANNEKKSKIEVLVQDLVCEIRSVKYSLSSSEVGCVFL